MSRKRTSLEPLLRTRAYTHVALSVIAGASALALSPCAVGPNFRAPAPPTQDGYTYQALPARTASTGVRGPGGEAQRFDLGRGLSAQWWTLFGSVKLDALIQQARVSYPDIAAQQAALQEDEKNVRAEEGIFLPQFQGTVYAVDLEAALDNTLQAVRQWMGRKHS